MVAQLCLFGGEKEIIAKKRRVNPQSRKIKVNIKLKRKYRLLEYVYSRLFDILNINILEQREIVNKGLLVAYVDERQAEVIGTQKMNINQKVRFYTLLMGVLNG